MASPSARVVPERRRRWLLAGFDPRGFISGRDGKVPLGHAVRAPENSGALLSLGMATCQLSPARHSLKVSWCLLLLLGLETTPAAVPTLVTADTPKCSTGAAWAWGGGRRGCGARAPHHPGAPQEPLSYFPGVCALLPLSPERIQPSLRIEPSAALCIPVVPRSCWGLYGSRGVNPLPALPDGLQQLWALLAGSVGGGCPPCSPKGPSWRAPSHHPAWGRHCGVLRAVGMLLQGSVGVSCH